MFRFLFECTCCFIVGDFFIYWEHRIMHIIPYLRYFFFFPNPFPPLNPNFIIIFYFFFSFFYLHSFPFLNPFPSPHPRKNIHSVHHAYHAPFSWAGGWVHPLEDMVVILCQTFFPIFISPVHPLSFWCFTAFWTICLIEEHSGHDVFWAPYNWMPFAKVCFFLNKKERKRKITLFFLF